MLLIPRGGRPGTLDWWPAKLAAHTSPSESDKRDCSQPEADLGIEPHRGKENGALLKEGRPARVGSVVGIKAECDRNDRSR